MGCGVLKGEIILPLLMVLRIQAIVHGCNPVRLLTLALLVDGFKFLIKFKFLTGFKPYNICNSHFSAIKERQHSSGPCSAPQAIICLNGGGGGVGGGGL